MDCKIGTVDDGVVVRWSGEEWLLLPDAAIFWPLQRTVILTDPHFGKDATFRNHGIAVPPGTTPTDLERLSQLIDKCRPDRLLILGDFFHARSSRTTETLLLLHEWRSRHNNLEVINIQGNHDRHAGDPPDGLNVRVEKAPYQLCTVSFSHHPDFAADTSVMCGHQHPGYRVRRLSGVSARLPCFWIAAKHLILPAFGSFTGKGIIEPGEGDRIFVIVDTEVIEIPLRK